MHYDMDELVRKVNPDVPLMSNAYKDMIERKSPKKPKITKPILTGTKGIDYVTCLECGERRKQLPVHLKYVHNMSCVQYRTKHLGAPVSSLNYRLGLSSVHRRRYAFRNFMKGVHNLVRPLCLCGCGERVVHVSNRYIRGHQNRGKPGWNNGLTAETDERVRRLGRNVSVSRVKSHAFRHFMNLTRDMLLPFCACGCGGRIKRPGQRYIAAHNRRGKTKETDPGCAAASAALTGRTKETHPGNAVQAAKMTGRTAQNDPGRARQAAILRGRTKETHPGVKARADALRGRTKENYPYLAKMSKNRLGHRKETHQYLAIISEKNIANWQDPDFVESRAGGRRVSETQHHADLKQQVITIFEEAGFTITTEKWLWANGHRYRVDIYAVRDDQKVITEVGGCSEHKLFNLRIRYGPENVFHIPYGDEEAIQKIRVECGLV